MEHRRVGSYIRHQSKRKSLFSDGILPLLRDGRDGFMDLAVDRA
jgi:hypothetical protein